MKPVHVLRLVAAPPAIWHAHEALPLDPDDGDTFVYLLCARKGTIALLLVPLSNVQECMADYSCEP